MSAGRPQRTAAPSVGDTPHDHYRETLSRLALHACEIAGLDRGCIFLRDQMSEVSMTAAAVHGLPDGLVGRTFGILDGLAGRVLISGEAMVAEGPSAFPSAIGQEAGLTHAVASVPIRSHGRVRAALSAGSVDPRQRIGERQLGALCEVADLGGFALEQAEARQELEEAVRASVGTLARAADMREVRPPRHSDRVVELAAAVGEELGMEPEGLAELRLAALLRDVGKIALPDTVVRKPGPLNAREWELVRRHPELGGELVFGIPGLEGAAVVVVHHHENYDGSGYPDGLMGEDIPLASRIVAVCDAYHAMISDHPYRPALRPITALRELQRTAGSQFDPEAVLALTRVARVSL